MTQEQSLKIRRRQLLEELKLEMKRTAGLVESAGELSHNPKHPSFYALNRAWSELESALKAIEAN